MICRTVYGLYSYSIKLDASGLVLNELLLPAVTFPLHCERKFTIIHFSMTTALPPTKRWSGKGARNGFLSNDFTFNTSDKDQSQWMLRKRQYMAASGWSPCSFSRHQCRPAKYKLNPSFLQEYPRVRLVCGQHLLEGWSKEEHRCWEFAQVLWNDVFYSLEIPLYTLINALDIYIYIYVDILDVLIWYMCVY